MQPPQPSKHSGRNYQHASTSHEVCINYCVQRGSLIPRRLHSGGGWIWRWIGFSRVFTSKNIIDQPSILRDRTRDARKTGVCCGLQKKAVTYIIPTLILSFHTIEYFVPFLGTKLFHNILNYQSHNHAVLNPCRDGCLAAMGNSSAAVQVQSSAVQVHRLNLLPSYLFASYCPKHDQ